MNSIIFIPEQLMVGFQNRKDTFTGKLAYVIYYDEKGKLRKEHSWQNWRDRNIDPQELVKRNRRAGTDGAAIRRCHHQEHQRHRQERPFLGFRRNEFAESAGLVR